VVSSSVKVDPAHALKIFVKRFAGVFFQMGAGETDFDFPARRRNDRNLPTLHDRQLELADLVALGKVRIKIILAGEDRAAV